MACDPRRTPSTGSTYADQLFYATHEPAGFDVPPYPEALHWVGPRMMELGRNNGTRNVVLYISRRPGRARSVVNEAALIAAMKAALRLDLEFVHLVDPSK